jgi:t-SNARE complex subunit (syntaxin)
MCDRLGELSTKTDDEPMVDKKGGSGNQEIADHMKLYEPIKQGLELIRANVDKIGGLKDKEKTISSEKTRKEIMDALDHIMSETTKTGRDIKNALDAIKVQDALYAKQNKDSAKNQMRVNLYQTHIRRFHQDMNEYNAASHEFKQSLQERTRRQLKIVDSKISDEEVEKIVASGHAEGVIQQVLVSENLQDVVRDIEDRHLDILKLERQVLEVYELFKDLATLVEIQQESLDVIENRIGKAKDYVEKAETQLAEAEVYQKKTRKKQCCLLILLLAILIAIIAPVLGTQLSKSA